MACTSHSANWLGDWTARWVWFIVGLGLGLGKTVASLLSLCSLSRRAPNFELPFPAPDRFPRSGRNLVRSSRLHRVLHVQVHLWTAQETRGKQGQWRSGTGHIGRLFLGF